MAFWSKKTILTKLIEYLNNNKSTYNIKDDIVSFEIYLAKENYSVTPYITFSNDDKNFSIKINLRKVDEDEARNNRFITKINDYNNKDSKFFIAKYNLENNILYLEYNGFIVSDNIDEVLDTIIEELFINQTKINEL